MIINLQNRNNNLKVIKQLLEIKEERKLNH